MIKTLFRRNDVITTLCVYWEKNLWKEIKKKYTKIIILAVQTTSNSLYRLKGTEKETVDLLTASKACQSTCPPSCSHVTKHGYYVFLNDDHRWITPSIIDLEDFSYLLKAATPYFHAIFERYFTAPLAFYTCSPRPIRLIIYQWHCCCSSGHMKCIPQCTLSTDWHLCCFHFLQEMNSQ